MADNIQVTEGSGKTIGSDECTVNAVSVQLQEVKIAHGAKGEFDAFADNLTPLPVYQGGSLTISVTPTVSTSPAYTAGDSIGGKFTLTSAARTSSGQCKLASLMVYDKSGQFPAMDIILFNADPSAATITDNAAFAISTDNAKVIGVASVSNADFFSTSGVEGVAQVPISRLGQVLRASGSANLYAAVLARTTPTFASTSDLTFRFTFTDRD